MNAPSRLFRHKAPTETTYLVTDRLHDDRVVYVGAEDIVSTVSSWLQELGVRSALVDELGGHVARGDWAAAHAIADCLSIDVTVASAS